jgi:serine/threonine protein kinase
MYMLVNGVFDMMQMLVIHRDLKLQNIMVHFPNDSQKLLAMNKFQRKEWLRTVDLNNTPFEVKIADFGFSKKLRNKS